MPEVSGKTRQLTKNGVEGLIFNGIPDWVYEGNEIFLVIFIDIKTDFNVFLIIICVYTHMLSVGLFI